MPERNDQNAGIPEQGQNNIESVSRPEGLYLLRGIASSTPRLLTVAALLNQASGEGYTPSQLKANFPVETGLISERFLEFARELRRFGITTVTPTGNTTYGETEYKIQLSQDINRDATKVIVGNVLSFLADNEDLVLEKVFTEAGSDREQDSFTTRITIMAALLNTYKESFSSGKQFAITVADLEKITGFDRGRINKHIDNLTTGLGLLTSLPRGYRLIPDSNTQEIRGGLMQRAYDTLLKAQENESVPAFHSVKTLKELTDVPDNLERGLKRLESAGIAEFNPKGAYTLTEDQVAILQRVIDIVEGSILQNATFISDGQKNYEKYINDPESLNEIWQESREIAIGRGSETAVEMQSILDSIIKDNPGIMLSLIRIFLPFHVKGRPSEKKLKRYGRASLQRALNRLREKESIRAEQFDRANLWYSADYVLPTPEQVVEDVVNAAEAAPSINPEQTPLQEETREPYYISDEEINKALENVDLTDTLGLFLLQLRSDPKYKVLPREKQIALFTQLHQQKNEGSMDKNLVDELMNRNLRLVADLAINNRNRIISLGIDVMDLIQEGTIALRYAVTTFNPEHNTSFYWYARQQIISTFNRAIETSKAMPMGESTARRVRKIIRMGITSSEHDAIKKVQELVRNSNTGLTVTDEVAQELLSMAENPQVIVSLPQPTGADDEEVEGNLLAPTQDTNREVVRKYIISRIEAKLNQRKAFIILNRFGLNSEEREFPLEEIGQILGITREAVRTSQERALRSLAADEELKDLFESYF